MIDTAIDIFSGLSNGFLTVLLSFAAFAAVYISCEPTESARELFDEDCEPVEEEQ